MNGTFLHIFEFLSPSTPAFINTDRQHFTELETLGTIRPIRCSFIYFIRVDTSIFYKKLLPFKPYIPVFFSCMNQTGFAFAFGSQWVPANDWRQLTLTSFFSFCDSWKETTFLRPDQFSIFYLRTLRCPEIPTSNRSSRFVVGQHLRKNVRLFHGKSHCVPLTG